MFLKVCWHPVRGTTWPSLLQYVPTQCCSLHLYSSSPSSSSFIATSASSELSVIPTGKFLFKYHFYVCVWPQVWTRKRKNRPTGKGNCIIYQKEINFRLVWCYKDKDVRLYALWTDVCSVSFCVYWIYMFVYMFVWWE